jgi:hypothetical protein
MTVFPASSFPAGVLFLAFGQDLDQLLKRADNILDDAKAAHEPSGKRAPPKRAMKRDHFLDYDRLPGRTQSPDEIELLVDLLFLGIEVHAEEIERGADLFRIRPQRQPGRDPEEVEPPAADEPRRVPTAMRSAGGRGGDDAEHPASRARRPVSRRLMVSG